MDAKLFVKIATSGFVLCLSTPSMSEECIIPGYNFVSAAAEQMHYVTPKKVSGEGECTYMTTSVIVAAANFGDGLACEIRLFEGATLHHGWKLNGMTFTGAETVVASREWPGEKIGTVVQVKVKRGETKSLNIGQVKLNSSDKHCDDWKEAL